jgi:DNA helicase-2/ATP-dependent DNA helicase PcrA
MNPPDILDYFAKIQSDEGVPITCRHPSKLSDYELNSIQESLLNSRERKSLLNFANLMGDLINYAKILKLSDLISTIVQVINYKDYLFRLNPIDSTEKFLNLDELILSTTKFSSESAFSSKNELQSFVEDAVLYISNDEMELKNKVNVFLMTMHAAKGLEFDCVYIIGLENGLLPSSMDSSIFNRKSKSKKNDITKTITNEKENGEMNSEFEEERRLLYVGMTRARKKLILTYRNRVTIGYKSIPVQPSVFLKDIDDDVLFFKY